MLRALDALKDIFTDTNSIVYNRVYNPYTADTQVNTYHSDKQEGKMSGQQIKGVGAGTNMTDGGQDYDIGYEAPKTAIMESSLKNRSVEIRTRLGHISHRIGIDQ